ncbi:MAG: hypothetical protein COB36_11690 [Alphaproteobacteria bacterium]|nr:MAG: hypothetical protein COB36_11690 [Alphaproteobacteria bacterium]
MGVTCKDCSLFEKLEPHIGLCNWKTNKASVVPESIFQPNRNTNYFMPPKLEHNCPCFKKATQ